MVNVHWQDAVDYCKWAHVSLPTEIQWEKAARGTDGRRFPSGNNWDHNRCRCSMGSNQADAGSTVLVGAYPTGASPYGVMDMAGNVWEWCHGSIVDGSQLSDPASTPRRVLRGGSWEGQLAGRIPRVFPAAAVSFLYVLHHRFPLCPERRGAVGLDRKQD